MPETILAALLWMALQRTLRQSDFRPQDIPLAAEHEMSISVVDIPIISPSEYYSSKNNIYSIIYIKPRLTKRELFSVNGI